MLCTVKSGGVLGIDGYKVDVEVNISQGLPQFITVGLPDTAVKESKERVKSAIVNSGFSFPLRKITVNLAPADIPKQGTLYDLPIAVGILGSAGLFNEKRLKEFAFVGELALDGSLRKIKGALPVAYGLKNSGVKNLILPEGNSSEASLVKEINVYGFSTLREIIDFLNGDLEKKPVSPEIDLSLSDYTKYPDFYEIKGQYTTKRCLEIAAAGFHNVLMVGSPGSGKSMMAKAFPSILPPMSFEEALQTTKIHSVAGILDDFIVRYRPYRNPHHTISDVALIGGGSFPKPGEVSLAHNGVLFLDEFPEFKRSSLEVLRQPMEDREVFISRATGRYRFPAKFQLIAAANPCPCGYKNDPSKECRCSNTEIRRYRNKLSGPIIDRIDLVSYVSGVSPEDLSKMNSGEKSEHIRERVIKAVEIQKKRFKETPITFNSEMTPSMIERFVKLENSAENALNTAAKKYSISARGYHRILKVSRTIADLEGSDIVKLKHIIEAINFRLSDELYS
ncbi:YifB family Mg chelatase-like AAA ATPase [Persephonella sp.]|uniref:YifB family Mg chelatase-like AAA ATPase n=1 Tax=Persephonella sp. TaxID=2060922 RepID=UPI0025EE20D0|nr:YifB family Mg chelatase-like AAA ATPase [Persephonella sp.]